MSNKLYRDAGVAGLASALVFGTVTVHASGFRLPETSIAGLSTANALVANPQELGALAYNPAAMAFHDGIGLSAGLILIDPNLSVEPLNHLTGTLAPSVDSQGRSPIADPSVYFMQQINAQWSWGLNISAPFGLETDWPAGTFDTFTLARVPFLQPTRSRVEVVNVNPNLALRFAPNTSVALGVDYYHLRDVKLNAVGITIGGDGGDFGWNLGLMHVAGPWSLGLSYRSKVKVDVDGTVNALPIGLGISPAQAQLEFPDILQFGVRYQVNDQLGVEFDLEHTGWSSFDVLVVDHTVASLPSPIVSTNDWDNVWAYRLGATYRLTPQTQLRLGYTYDNTAQDDARFSVRVPDADRQLFSIGIAQDIAGWTLEAGYMYVLFKDHNYRGAVPFGTFGSDANGTTAYDGDYSADVHLLGIGISKKF